MRPVHDRASRDAELATTIVALPSSPFRHATPRGLAAGAVLWRQEVVTVDDPAMRANGATVPANLLHVLIGRGLCGDLLCKRYNAELFHVPILATGCINSRIHAEETQRFTALQQNFFARRNRPSESRQRHLGLKRLLLRRE